MECLKSDESQSCKGITSPVLESHCELAASLTAQSDHHTYPRVGYQTPVCLSIIYNTRTPMPRKTWESSSELQLSYGLKIQLPNLCDIYPEVIMGLALSLLWHVFPEHARSSQSEKVPFPLDSNTALANELRGQRFRVDMTRSFCEWPSGARNPHYKRLQMECDRVLEMYEISCFFPSFFFFLPDLTHNNSHSGVPDIERCQKFKRCDFALFSVLWWPSADWDDLYTAMLFTVALFVWDDTIDTNEHILASDFAKAEIWRNQSLDYFRYHLQLSSTVEEPCCPDDICLLFEEFAQRFCRDFGEG